MMEAREKLFAFSAELEPKLDFMEDYGYICRQPVPFCPSGRPPLPRYTVNPKTPEGFCHAVPVLSGGMRTAKPLIRKARRVLSFCPDIYKYIKYNILFIIHSVYIKLKIFIP